ncbi:unnamed protein product [Spirodela intermedia]|uniref:Uncharacterized protein n=1 Tax=Spirodela intermedia TaxID=51605 RepID=A0A7I8IRM8_SPIIN|nr:unnamed protein product [Spirodela intermedia]CAA6660435.1 unnamed protein product [Spirodela intermedia]
MHFKNPQYRTPRSTPLSIFLHVVLSIQRGRRFCRL